MHAETYPFFISSLLALSFASFESSLPHAFQFSFHSYSLFRIAPNISQDFLLFMPKIDF